MENKTIEQYGKIIAPGVIQFERLLPGPIERVWAYLTESDKRAQWLASGKTELKVGGQVDFFFRHKDLSDHNEPIPEKYKHMEDGTGFTGQVLKIDPPRLLCYTWGGEGTEDVSEVTFELSPEGDQVLLTLTHRKLTDDMLTSVASGWHTHLGILSDRLTDNPPKGFWGVHQEMEKNYAERLGLSG